MLRAIPVLLVTVLLSGWCAEPWKAFPRKTTPDLQFSTGGGAHGYDVYVWECHDGDTARTVVFQYSAEMSCQAPAQQRAPCGAMTAFETSLGGERREPCRASRAWKP